MRASNIHIFHEATDPFNSSIATILGRTYPETVFGQRINVEQP